MFAFFVVARKKANKKLIAETFRFGFSWVKNGGFVTHNRFSKNGLLKPQCLQRF